ncbi:translesion error-prone DNA polymerase V subunit UmuC [Paucibacter soli]|uniref:translesion error-prone DNA polymerase V subunit UmuC n=1 Tax=Paucibacter soli TaxID=3133433 RepID=UPI0030B5BBF0
MYALVDGNAFYVSAERSFRPSLQGQPVVVLSNNDGCAIARSNEAKDLGIKMGEPAFRLKELERTAGLISLSANFELYGDVSERMMAIVGSFAPRQSIYSIDESFLDFAGVNKDLTEIGWAIHAKVLMWTGIPTCVGFGPTKTLAKLANHIAKSAERKPGLYPAHLAKVCHLGELAQEELDKLLAVTPVQEVWGVGPRIGAQLEAAGIRTVLDLVRVDVATIRKRFSLVLEKTVRELQGVSCISIDEVPQPRQQIMCSRSFGRPVMCEADLIEASSAFASRAAEKLRGQSSFAGAVSVFIRTSLFRLKDAQYSGSITVPLVRPTSDTNLIVSAATRGLRAIFREGYRFAKCGVMLVDLQPEGLAQGELDLFVEGGAGEGAHEERRDRSKLMSAMDQVNARYGRGSLHVASTGVSQEKATWSMRQERRTPRYTTCLNEIPIARA